MQSPVDSVRKTIPPVVPFGHGDQTQCPVASTPLPCEQMHAPISTSPSTHGGGAVQEPSVPRVWPGGQEAATFAEDAAGGGAATADADVTGSGGADATGVGATSVRAGGATGAAAQASTTPDPDDVSASNQTSRGWDTGDSASMTTIVLPTVAARRAGRPQSCGGGGAVRERSCSDARRRSRDRRARGGAGASAAPPACR